MLPVATVRRVRKRRGVEAVTPVLAALGFGLIAGFPATPVLAEPPTWTARFNAASPDPWGQPPFEKHAMATDALGNVYVAGTVSVDSSLAQQDFLVAKYDPAGTLIWYRTTDGGSQLRDTVFCMALSPDAVFVTGETCTSSNCDPDFLTVKYDAASGAQRWAMQADGPGPDVSGLNYDTSPCVAVDNSGNPAVTGTTHNPAPGNLRDFLTIRYNGATGAELWRRTKSINVDWSSDFAGPIGLGADGHVVVTGSGGDGNLLTVKYDGASGVELWAHSATGVQNGFPTDLAFDASSNPIVVGRADGTVDSKFFTLKYLAANGGLGWFQKVDYAVGKPEAAVAIALDSVGNAYVTGRAQFTDSDSFHTVKYEALSGTQLWAHSWGTGLPGDGYSPAAIAYSAATDRVIVTGKHSTASGEVFFTESLNAQNPTSGPSQVEGNFRLYNTANSVVVDGAGNAIVAGYSRTDFGPAFQGDLRVVKYDTTLAQTWTRIEPALETHEVLGGVSPPQFGRKKIAVDRLGNTVVVGSSSPKQNGTNSDFLIQKYGPGGNLVWSRAIDGGAGADFGTAVAFGGGSDVDVYVTGWSLGLGTDYDVLTLRLNSANGATIWTQRYNSPSNQADVSYGIAVGASRVFVVGASASGGQYHLLVLGYPLADGISPWLAAIAPFPGGSAAYAVARGCIDEVFNSCVEGVYITGVAVNATDPSSGNEFLTALFDADSGVLLAGLTQGGGGNAVGTSIATFGTPATMVATGRRGGDWMTTAFQGSSTTALWTQVRDFDARDDQAYDVAFDPAGDAFVTGYTTRLPGRNRQVATIKYAGATGAELAVARSGWIDEDLTGYAVATDFAGQVFVAGSRFSLADQKNDFLLFKYNNGLSLLGGEFLDANNSDDYGTALAVEKSSGDAVIAGTSFALGPTGDFLIAKYRAPEKGNFFTTTPCRLYDSRNDPGGPISGGQTRVIFAQGFVGSCSLLTPAVKSLAINVTAVGATGAGFLQLYPANIATPNTSVVNFAAGRTRANNAILNLATNAAGTFAIRSGLPPGQTVHVIVDVVGYFD